MLGILFVYVFFPRKVTFVVSLLIMAQFKKLTIEDICVNSSLHSSFVLFLRTRHMENTFELWMEIERFEKECERDSERREAFNCIMER